jgi:ABC-type lipoprotein release transport system permease subunit
MRLGNAPSARTTTPHKQQAAGAPRSTRRAQRAGALSAARLALRRLSRGKTLLLTVALGMLVAVTMICIVPLFTALMINVQLQRALSTSDPTQRNLEVQVRSAPVDAQMRVASDPQVKALARRYISGFTKPTSTYYVVADDTLLIGAGGKAFSPVHGPGDVSFRAYDYAVAAPYMHIKGTAPQDLSSGTLQALVTTQMAATFGLKVGDTVKATEFGDHSRTITVRITGIWHPVNPQDAFWNGQVFTTSSDPNSTQTYPVLLTYDGFFTGLRQFAGLSMTQGWIYYGQPQRITAANLLSVVSNVGDFRSRINGDLLAVSGVSDAAVHSALDSILNGVNQQEALLAQPLYVIAVQVVGLALLFVAAMAGLLIEGQSQEIALLKSRGLSGAQILGVYLTQGMVLGVVAMVIGPVLAAALSLALVHKLLPAAITTAAIDSGFLSQIASPRAVLVPAVAGTVLGIATIVLAALQAAQRDILAFRREEARPSRPPLWRRYYLDVALAALCVVGYYELGQFGSASTRLAVSASSANPLLLASPALLLLAGALLVLRLVPWAAALGERLAARGRGITAVLAFAQVERTPGRYTRLTMLLVLAVGLGLFALTFNATLARNVSDRVAYSVGADLRLTENLAETGSLGERIQAKLQQVPGVASVTPVYRTLESTTADLGNQSVDLLAIDPATFGQVAGPVSWRADYASQSLDQLMAQMQTHLQGHGAYESDTPIWAIASQTLADQLQLRVGDRFAIQFTEAGDAPTNLIVGAIVHEFPTLYPEAHPGGFLVIAYSDFRAGLAAGNPAAASTSGPNEFWLHTTGNPDVVAQRLQAAQDQLDIHRVQNRADQLTIAETNPISSGISGLLLVGAFTAALLAILGGVVQSLLAVRQRVTQFAILRTIGMANQQMARLLLGEQVVVYLFGLVGGTLLGLLMTTATLPYLQFSDTTVDSTKLGVPPYELAFRPGDIILFYAALLAAFVLALVLAARFAATIGLGKALRLGED